VVAASLTSGSHSGVGVTNRGVVMSWVQVAQEREPYPGL
jgi:hypothetical protein